MQNDNTVRANHAGRENMTLAIAVEQVAQWHHDRNLIDGSTDQAQFMKLLEEFGELAASISRGKDIKDDLGDMMVVMINIMERNNHSMLECLDTAWVDIKDRKGKMVDGIFVKEADLP
jgi:NTP pyrophosphatase (non-canonical NTP hydrolase)